LKHFFNFKISKIIIYFEDLQMPFCYANRGFETTLMNVRIVYALIIWLYPVLWWASDDWGKMLKMVDPMEK